ncbi:hypothetical protein EB796_024505 [Bugula neritina]|uniref:Uncharacterized protein n=1 Tax=Bugula neritina TaxID=10212 RepID=A0A7J7ITP7_BUGNE|nr:hypothetical protein EB796_024505 [Bugula neritina]
MIRCVFTMYKRRRQHKYQTNIKSCLSELSYYLHQPYTHIPSLGDMKTATYSVRNDASTNKYKFKYKRVQVQVQAQVFALRIHQVFCGKAHECL